MLSLYFCRTVRVDCPVFIWRHTVKDEKIKVLALLPMELPKEIELDNTLEAMQNFVGGLIECITCTLYSDATSTSIFDDTEPRTAARAGLCLVCSTSEN